MQFKSLAERHTSPTPSPRLPPRPCAWTATLRVPALVVALSVSAGAGACASNLAGSGASAKSAPADTPYAAVQQMAKVLVQIENEYVDPVDRRRLLEGAVRGMVAELDPHSSYMAPDEFAAFESDTEGRFGGIGIEVETRDDKLVVLAVFEGAPADRAGIRSGDVIAAVDGKDPGAEPLDKLVKHLRGLPGTHVKVAVRRAGVSELLQFDLAREIVNVVSVSSKLLPHHLAYIRIGQFQERTHDELLAAVGNLRQRAGGPLAGVILDLRNDPGGLVDQAADVADEFIDHGTIYTARHRGKIVEEVTAHGGGALSTEPCVAIVNQYTASASELVAGALQDHGRATIVGEPTFGKGSVQAIISLADGAGMRLTVSRYYTPSGHAIQADGVHPDVAVESPPIDASGSYREKDLEGHLHGEASASPAPKTVIVVPGDAGAPLEPSVGREARNVPDDPEQSTDPVLKVAWQTLRQRVR
jgi:carboxyl-terminal processing protease